MNKEVKAKWVAALRSGKYQQMQGQLTDGGDRFCCLGVLCDISGVGSWNDVHDDETPSRNTRYEVGVEAEFELPPAPVLDWAGFSESKFIDERVPTVRIDNAHRKLHGHNDYGKTFAQIADAIEEQL